MGLPRVQQRSLSRLRSLSATLCEIIRIEIPDAPAPYNLAAAPVFTWTNHPRTIRIETSSFTGMQGIYTPSDIEIESKSFESGGEGLGATCAITGRMVPEVTGNAFPTDGFSYSMFKAGRFDEARVYIQTVDWTDLANPVLQKDLYVPTGEIQYDKYDWRIPLEGLSSLLVDNEILVNYSSRCPFAFGDVRCNTDGITDITKHRDVFGAETGVSTTITLGTGTDVNISAPGIELGNPTEQPVGSVKTDIEVNDVIRMEGFTNDINNQPYRVTAVAANQITVDGAGMIPETATAWRIRIGFVDGFVRNITPDSAIEIEVTGPDLNRSTDRNWRFGSILVGEGLGTTINWNVQRQIWNAETPVFDLADNRWRMAVRLESALPAAMVIGQRVRIIPGCSKQKEADCAGTHFNGRNFGGHDIQPDSRLVLDGGELAY